MKKTLTHAVVAALKAPDTGQVDVWDARRPGFGIRVGSAGTKTWLLMYRQQDGRKRRLALGRFPELSVADARAKATSVLGDIAKGENPAAERARAKADPTFGELAELYLERHARVKKKPSSAQMDEYIIKKDLLPVWKDRKLPSITRRDVVALLDSVVARNAPVHANRVRALASTIFNFSIGRDLIEYNPVHRIPRPALERSRDRRLDDRELCRFLTALESEPFKLQALYKLALLTAARRGELLGMRWDELDLDLGWWILPGDRSKGGIEHRIPLSPTAISLLKQLQIDHNSPFVFTGGRIGRPLVNQQKMFERIRANAELVDLRFHDLRRSAASGMTSIGIPRLTVSKILGHAEAGVTRIYDRHDYDREKQQAILRWDRHLAKLLTATSNDSNVIPLHA